MDVTNRNPLCVMSIWCAIGWLLCQAAPAQTTWYVATNGNNSTHSGTNGWDDAYLTINYAVSKSASLDTILVGPGEYALTATISIPADKDIYVLGVAGREATIINGNYPASLIRGILMYNGHVSGFTITNCYREASSGFGAGVYMDGAKLTYCIITDNGNALSNVPAYGGGVTMGGTSRSVMSNCIVRGNYAGTQGGGVVVLSNSFGEIRDCLIENNFSGGSCGGVLLQSSGKIYNSVVSCNTAVTFSGGAMVNCNFSADLTLAENCVICGNYAFGSNTVIGVGGIYNNRGGVIRNCLISGNIGGATNWAGGVILVREGIVESCTIVSNQAPLGGGLFTYPMASSDTNMLVRNNIIAFNTAATGADLRQLKSGGIGAVFNNNCIIATDGQSMAGADNIAEDPLLSANCRLLRDSPCVNAGLNEGWMDDAVDLDGRPRLDRFTRQVDMGCYEYIFRGTMFGVR